ncbi:hypothetical protein NDU88_006290 [Pleurodeles waltl]|uniref:Helix-turn-helix domain-containing protein n=1 Tax=Pleurodeles waltl TaxID=8319 RepID=A0AAV7X089_PLEWA|nr:hypothetical protein NDU88_006290 [Pleurodeles waltl]
MFTGLDPGVPPLRSLSGSAGGRFSAPAVCASTLGRGSRAGPSRAELSSDRHCQSPGHAPKLFVLDKVIQSDIFRKPTACNSVLQATSSHPKRTIKSIPYGELVSARRNCSQQQDFEKRIEITMSDFHKRGYKTSILEKAKTKIMKVDRKYTLQNKKWEKEKEKANKISEVRFITKFDLYSSHVYNALRKNCHLLNSAIVPIGTISKNPRIVYRRGRILTFHRKYDYMYVESDKELSVENNSRELTSEVEESHVSDGNQSDVPDPRSDRHRYSSLVYLARRHENRENSSNGAVSCCWGDDRRCPERPVSDLADPPNTASPGAGQWEPQKYPVSCRGTGREAER